MDLNYIRENDIHEKYLLNQLGSEEIADYEDFIKKNPTALQEYEETKKLLSGVRSIGHEAMRREIEEQVREIKNPQTDWSMLYRAAAVLFLFAILPAVVYYNVYVLDLPAQSEKQLIMDSLQKMEEKDRSHDGEIYDTGENIAPKSESAPVRKKVKAPAVPTFSSAKEEVEIEDHDISGSAEKTSFSTQGAGSAPTNPLEKSTQDIEKQISVNASEKTGTIKKVQNVMAPIAETTSLRSQISQLKETKTKAQDKVMSFDQPESDELINYAAPSKKPKVLKIVKEDKILIINLVHAYQTEVIDSLFMQILDNSLNPRVELHLPAELFMTDENKINLVWIKNEVLIQFKNIGEYTIILNKNETYAKKVK